MSIPTKVYASGVKICPRRKSRLYSGHISIKRKAIGYYVFFTVNAYPVPLIKASKCHTPVPTLRV